MLKTLFEEKRPLTYLFNREEYALTLAKMPDQQLFLRPDRPIPKIAPRNTLNLMFTHWGQVVKFSAEVTAIKEGIIITEVPERLFKDLDRSFARVALPEGLKVSFVFQGERYALNYPVVPHREALDSPPDLDSLSGKDLAALIKEISRWARGLADGSNLHVFKDGAKPRTVEERIICETGRVLYIPSTETGLPQIDPYPDERIITEQWFLGYLKNSGASPQDLSELASRFFKLKREKGFLSDLWVPIIFQEYGIGYVHLWTNAGGAPPLDYGAVENAVQFSKLIAFSLKSEGYFDGQRITDETFEGRIIDISASGLLFVAPQSSLAASLRLDCELKVKIEAPRRSIATTARIIRRCTMKAGSYTCIGCQFMDMSPEDVRFLFEFIYGKPFEGADATFLVGQV